MSMSRRTAVVAAGTCAIVASSVLVAWAQIPAQDGTISACYGKSAGFLRVIDESQECKSSETQLTWNQAGQPGPAGPEGPQGPAGPDGLLRATVSDTGVAYSGDATSASHDEPGRYTVSFAEDISDCTFAVTPGWNANTVGSNSVVNVATVSASGSLVTHNSVRVTVTRSDGFGLTDSGFHLLVAC